MNIYEFIGRAWVILTSSVATCGFFYFAGIGLRTFSWQVIDFAIAADRESCRKQNEKQQGEKNG